MVEFLPPWVNMPPLSPDRRGPAAGRSGSAPAIAPVARPAARRHRASPTGPTPVRSAQSGLPCLVFGPGDIAQAHTKDEWIELDQVRIAAEAYYQIALALGRE